MTWLPGFALSRRGIAQSFAQRFAFQQLHHQKWRAFMGTDVENGKNIGVIQRAGGAGFCKRQGSAMPVPGIAFLLNTGREQELGGIATPIFYVLVQPKWVWLRLGDELSVGDFCVSSPIYCSNRVNPVWNIIYPYRLIKPSARRGIGPRVGKFELDRFYGAAADRRFA